MILGKLNKILFKLNSLENRMDIFEEKMQSSSDNDQEEVLTLLPISTFDDLTYFEKEYKIQRCSGMTL